MVITVEGRLARGDGVGGRGVQLALLEGQAFEGMHFHGWDVLRRHWRDVLVHGGVRLVDGNGVH